MHSLIFELGTSWGVEKFTKPFFRVSWKLRKCKNKVCTKLFATSKQPFQIWHSHYIFVNSFSNFNPRIWILQRLACWKMYRTTILDVLGAEKWAKPKWVLFFKTSCSCFETFLKWIIYLFHHKTGLCLWTWFFFFT